MRSVWSMHRVLITPLTGAASVQRLPLDIIKIDHEIVQSIEELRSNALANTIINMARNLGLRTVAEGVETESQALELARLGCEFAQGFHLARPQPARPGRRRLPP